jgi:Asp-tRNA(Asn)/Glu-tRNA(Gln) amidotransferase B subunit
MGQSFYQQSTAAFKAITERMEQMDNQIISVSHVLKEIVGKELMRAQALHKVLMDKGLFTDEDLKKALEDMIAEAKADLQKEAETVKAAKEKAVEILVPNTVKADSNQDPTPTPAVVPVTGALPPTEAPNANGQV